MDINERVSAIKGDNEKISLFIEEYKPFISGVVSRKLGGFYEYGVDDELSIALSAFYEAINAFDNSRGNFLSFASTVIHRRLIDYMRKQRYDEVSVEECEERSSDILGKRSAEEYEKQSYEENLRTELEMFRREMNAFGITMDKLVKASPKHKSTKLLYSKVADYIAANSELTEHIIGKGYLPIAPISEGMGINRKKIERGRDYIIACVVIRHGDYTYMKEYVTGEVK